MTTVAAGTSSTYIFTDATNELHVEASSTRKAVVTVHRNGVMVFSTILASVQTVGPFNVGDVAVIAPQAAAIDYRPRASFAGAIGKAVAGGVAQPWAVSGAGAFSVVAQAMLQLGGGPTKKAPLPSVPYTHTGTTYYIDPDWTGTASGTFAAPFNSMGQLPGLAANTAVLFKAGTQLTTSSFFELSARGTSPTAAVVFGVYDPVTGRRLFNSQGKATIICGAGSNNFFVRVGEGQGAGVPLFTCFDGLKILAANAGGGQAAIFMNGGHSLQVRNCIIASAGKSPVRVFSRNVAIEDNDLTTLDGSPGISIVGDTGGDTASIYARNRIHDCGALFHDAQGPYGFSGTIADNVITDCSLYGHDFGIFLLNGGGAAQIYRNTLARCGISLEVYSGATASNNVAGLLIENNTAGDCEFPLHFTNSYGFNSAFIQFNRFTNAGSRDGGLTAANATNYGRCLETYGSSPAFLTGGCVIRWNYLAGAKCFILTDPNGGGSEGVGLGLDENSTDITAYGNYIEGCEGNGIQLNRCGNGIILTGNIVTGNCQGRAGTIYATYAQQAEINVVVTRLALIANNFTSKGNGKSKYGIWAGGTPAETCFGTQIVNNMSVGHLVAGTLIDPTGNAITEDYNMGIDVPTLRVDKTNGVAVPGANSMRGSAADYDISNSFIKAAPAGRGDATGLAAPGFSFTGLPLSHRTPRGALHASF